MRSVRISRERTVAGQCSSETVYAITSLERSRAGAKRLLSISRQHWEIENRPHWVRDVSMQEDRCRVRTGAVAQALAALRNTALTLLRRLGHNNTSAALERRSEHRNRPST